MINSQIAAKNQSCDCLPCVNTIADDSAVVKDGGIYCSEDCAIGRTAVDHQDKLDCCSTN